jgi:hypothetical protein
LLVKNLSIQGTLTARERLSVADLLIKVACFVNKINKFSIEKGADFEPVSTWGSTELSLPLPLGFTGEFYGAFDEVSH